MTLGTSLARTIKKQLIRKIENNSSAEIVYSYEHLPVSKFPAVFVTAGDMEGEFFNTAENLRIYAFNIRILYQIGQDADNVDDSRLQNAEEAIGQVVDEIVNALDKDYELGQFNADVINLEAADAIYGYALYEGGYAKEAQLTIRIQTVFNVTS